MLSRLFGSKLSLTATLACLAMLVLPAAAFAAPAPAVWVDRFSPAPAEPVYAGDKVTYDVTAENGTGAGVTTSTGNVLTISWDAGLVFDAVSTALPAWCAYDGATKKVTCTLGDYTAGMGDTTKIVLDSVDGGVQEVYGELDTNETAAVTDVNSSDFDYRAVDLDAGVAKTPASTTHLPSAAVTINATVDNLGASKAYDTETLIYLPTGTTIVSKPAACTSTVGTWSVEITCNGDLPVGLTTYQVDVQLPAAYGRYYYADVNTYYSNDPTSANDYASIAVPVTDGAEGDLALSYSASTTTPRANEPLTYTAVVRNLAATGQMNNIVVSMYTGYYVTGTAPALTVQSASSGCAAVTGGTGRECTIGTLAAGASATVTMTVVPSAAGKLYFSAWQGSSSYDTNEANDGLDADIVVGAALVPPVAPPPPADTTAPAINKVTTPPAPLSKLIAGTWFNTVYVGEAGVKVTEKLEVTKKVAKSLSIKAKTRTVVIGAGAATSKAAGPLKVQVKLTSPAKKALRKGKKKNFKATLVIKATDAAGNVTTKKRPVQIKTK